MCTILSWLQSSRSIARGSVYSAISNYERAVKHCCRSSGIALPPHRQRFTESIDTNDESQMEGDTSTRVIDEEHKLFVGQVDRYNGVTVDTSIEKCSRSNFEKCLEGSLQKWIKENKSTIWFRVDLSNVNWIPMLAKKGFKFHHAKENFAIMYKWLPMELGSNVPPYAHTNLGVGGFVLDDKTGEILIVKDKYSMTGKPTHWKLPGGFVNPGENIPDAVMREVREETGVLTEFVGLIGFRHAHDYAFGCSDIYIVACLRPLTRDIHRCEREIVECTWKKLEDYANDPDVLQNNRIVARAMLKYTKDQNCLKLTEGEHPVSKKPVFIYTFDTVSYSS